MANVYEQANQPAQDIVAPELKGLGAEIHRLDEKFDSKHNEVLSEFKRLNGKIDSKHGRFLSEIYRLDNRIDALSEKIEFGFLLGNRLTVLEAKGRGTGGEIS